MKIKEMLFHVIITGIIALGVFALLNIGDDPEPIYYLFTFILGGIFRMIFMLGVGVWK